MITGSARSVFNTFIDEAVLWVDDIARAAGDQNLSAARVNLVGAGVVVRDFAPQLPPSLGNSMTALTRLAAKLDGGIDAAGRSSADLSRAIAELDVPGIARHVSEAPLQTGALYDQIEPVVRRLIQDENIALKVRGFAEHAATG